MPLLNNVSWHFDSYGNKNTDLVIEQYNSTFKCLSNWDEYEEDFYLLQFKSAEVFKLIDLKQYIPADIFDRIRNEDDKCHLLISNYFEGFNKFTKIIYDEIIFKYNIPPKKLVLASGALDIEKTIRSTAQKLKTEPFGLISTLEFEYGSNMFIQSLNPIVKKKLSPNTLQLKAYTKKFLCMNRRWRLHRPILVAALCALDLIDEGHISLGLSDDNRSWETEWNLILNTVSSDQYLSNLLINNKEKIHKLGYLYLDTNDLVTNRAVPEMNPKIKKLYEETFFSVVPETLYFKDYSDWDDSCFMSEKIFKTVHFKHPFILLSTPGTLAYFKSLGYKTFHPWINESYDEIEDNNKRMAAVVKEIQRLCDMPNEEITDFLESCRDIVEHNYKLLESKTNFAYRVI